MIASEIIERRNAGERVGFLTWEEFKQRFADRLKTGDDPSLDDRVYVLKTHDHHPGFEDLILNGIAKAIYSFRDIRDVIPSLMWKLNFSFEEVLSSEALRNALDSYYKWTRIPGIVIQRYENILIQPDINAGTIADHLNIHLELQELREIISACDIKSNLELIQKFKNRLIDQSADLDLKENALIYDPKSLLHWNHIRPGDTHNWRIELTAQELETLRPIAAQWLIDAGFESDDQWTLTKSKETTDRNMTSNQFISYAQNFEDVMLWRALKHIENGFYVDVGANDPVIDSVTLSFYERGWRGINIEPMQEYFSKLCQERPEDMNIPIAVGASEAEAVFYEIPETGLSTFDAETAYKHQHDGWTVNIRKVQITTLNQILAEHEIPDQIHFLKIDVEGFEKTVFEGLDLSQWRPWIIIVEATAPGTNTSNHENWDSSLISANYVFAYFDGLNRFYIANEHLELIEAFSAPPNIFDGFISAHFFNTLEALAKTSSALEEQSKVISSITNQLELNERELETLRSELSWMRSDLTYSRNEVIRLRAESEDSRQQITRLQLETSSFNQHLTKLRDNEANLISALEAERAEAARFKQEYQNIFGSMSYKITAPLRLLYTWVEKLRGRPAIATPSFQNPNTVNGTQSDRPLLHASISQDEQHFLDLFNRELEKRSTMDPEEK